MQIVVLSDAALKEELLANGTKENASITWVSEVHEFLAHPSADVFLDLLFQNNPARLQVLHQLAPKTVIINSVVDTLNDTDVSFVRINAWPTFLRGGLVEASVLDEAAKSKAEAAFFVFNKRIEWLPDEVGFVTARVISTIINEAFFALAEGVSTPQEIDTAMKLGTNYPYGPFEWADKLGVQNIAALLTRLSRQYTRYTPCTLLVQKTGKII